MIDDQRRELSDTVRDVAEGFSATDPAHAWKYREEAKELGGLSPPRNVDELSIREAEARMLKHRWAQRFRKEVPL